MPYSPCRNASNQRDNAVLAPSIAQKRIEIKKKKLAKTKSKSLREMNTGLIICILQGKSIT